MNHYVFGLWNKLLSQEPHCVEDYFLQHFEWEDMQDSVAGRLLFTARLNGCTCLLQYRIGLDNSITLLVGGSATDEMRRVVRETEVDTVRLHLDSNDVEIDIEILPLHYEHLEEVWSIGRTLSFYTGHNSDVNNQ